MSLCAKMSHIFNFNSVPSVEVDKSYLRDFGSPWDIAFSDIVAQHWVPQERGLSLRSTVAGLMGGGSKCATYALIILLMRHAVRIDRLLLHQLFHLFLGILVSLM